VERKGAPPSPDALTGWDVIGYDKSLGAVPGALWLEEHARGAYFVLRANSIIAALNATIVGMGIGVLPCFLGGSEPELRRLTSLASESVMLPSPCTPTSLALPASERSWTSSSRRLSAMLAFGTAPCRPLSTRPTNRE